ncbi:MAG TPA: isoprenylcysteine carboxylmethyltransferase family protein [Polyangiaceae bacterium]|nr:isoprenylcysteine carboxylmethyltransferase family protein [Polyangiaceae bacterium]
MTSARDARGGAKVRFPPPLVFLASLLGGLALQYGPWPLVLPASGLRWVAGLGASLGGVLLLWNAQLWFSRTGQHPAPWKPSPELLVAGVYRFTRNPMYLGFTLFQLGLGVALGNGWLALSAPLALGIVHFLAVRPEEAYLTEKFGEAYLRYLTRVRRYL